MDGGESPESSSESACKSTTEQKKTSQETEIYKWTLPPREEN
jgi:hypothetical protein